MPDTPEARDQADVQADVNLILDTLLTAHSQNEALVIDFALDAVKRLRKDADGLRKAKELLIQVYRNEDDYRTNGWFMAVEALCPEHFDA